MTKAKSKKERRKCKTKGEIWIEGKREEGKEGRQKGNMLHRMGDEPL